MTEKEQSDMDEMKRKTAALLQEKANREEKLRDQIIEKLDCLTKEVHTIRLSTNELPQLRAELREQEKRLKCLEDLAMKMIAGISTALAIIAALWKLIDKLWQ